ncbi:hypothetical protein [Nitrosomonas sp.]
MPNLTRITVQGSTTAPSEWLRLTIDPSQAPAGQLDECGVQH